MNRKFNIYQEKKWSTIRTGFFSISCTSPQTYHPVRRFINIYNDKCIIQLIVKKINKFFYGCLYDFQKVPLYKQMLLFLRYKYVAL